MLVAKGQVEAVAFKNEKHAERSAIEQAQAQGIDLRGATLYTTLEPCVERRPAQAIPSCASLIVSAGINKVVIGRYDPNPLVQRLGWRKMRDAKVKLEDFPVDLREQIDVLNNQFSDFFKRAIGPRGGAKVDHKDLARFIVQFSEDDQRSIEIGWSPRGKDSAYALAHDQVQVAHARFAQEFSEIDDPNAYDCFKHAASLEVGEVGIFRNDEAFVLVKVKQVESGPDYGDANFFVNFEFEVRLRTCA